MKRVAVIFSAMSALYMLCGAVAQASQIQMTCRNPRREYLATFDADKNTLVLTTSDETTPYKVVSVQKNGTGYRVKGHTVGAGPDFTAYIGGYNNRIELDDGGKKIQTDRCR